MKNFWNNTSGAINYLIFATFFISFAATSIVYMLIHDILDNIISNYWTIGVSLGNTPDPAFDETFYALGGMFEYSIIWAFMWIIIYTYLKSQQ